MQLAAALMTALALFAWRAAGGAALPSLVLCGSWAVVYLLQAAVARDMYDSEVAALVVAGISLFFVVGNALASRVAPPPGAGPGGGDAPPADFGERARVRLRWMVVGFGLLALVGAVRYMRALGLFDASSPGEMLLMAGAAREKLFAEEITVPAVDRIGFLIAYSGSVLSTAYWYYFGWRWWLLVPPLAVVLLGAAQAGRAGTLIVLLQWGGAVLLKRAAEPGHRLPRAVVVLPASLFAVFVLGQLLREGFAAAGGEDVVRVLLTLRSYLFGGVSAFAYYCDHMWSAAAVTLGKFSFSSLWASLGIAAQEAGVYDDYVQIAPTGEVTNIYTAYRSFIDDFTLPGAFLLYGAAGLACGHLYGRLVRGDRRLATVLIPVVSWLMFSPLYSLTYFNSFLLSLFLPYLLVRWATRGAGAPPAPAGPGAA
jgi:oligosaccharide repeat unit polymerase